MLTVAAKIAVNPTATASLGKAVDSTITVELNATYSPPFSTFWVAIFYNKDVMLFQGLDYSSSVFSSDYFVSSECSDGRAVDGSGNDCNQDLRFDEVGVVSLNLVTSSGVNTQTPTGRLFTVTFRVVSIGFSAIHIVFAELQTAPDGIPLQTVASDGYFTNQLCGGILCKPPVVSFITPLRPVVLRPVSVNGTAMSQNPNGTIIAYNWTWGSGFAKQHYNSPASNATIIFGNIGEILVTLSAQDNYDARAYYTVTITAFKVWIDLGLAPLSFDRQVGVLPGTVVHMVATAFNYGTKPQNSTIRLAIDNQNVATQAVLNLQPSTSLSSSLAYDWHTTGLSPRVYRVDAALEEVMNVTTGQRLENDTAIIGGKLVDPNNVRVAFVQLIEARPPGFGAFLGLTLPATFGLGIVLVSVVFFAVGLVRKSRARSEEPL